MDAAEVVTSSVPRKCLVIDGMAVLHLFSDRAKVNCIYELSSLFNSRIEDKMFLYEEVRLVFDPYCEGSKKMATRERRKRGGDATYYAVNENTNLCNIPISHFLSHEKTKQEVAVYLANQFMEKYKDRQTIYTSAYTKHDVYTCVTRTNCSGNVVIVDELNMNHDEADTMLITHAIHFTNHAHLLDILHVWSPDTDMLLLLVHYKLYSLTNVFLFWHGKVFDITGIYSYLGPVKSSGVLAWHAITGCDTTGRFAGRGKKTWWNLFISLDKEKDKDIIDGFSEFGENAQLVDSTENAMAKFVSLGYSKGCDNLASARWTLFTKKMAEGDKLPPTPNAFKQHLLRALLQTHVWRHAYLANIPWIDAKNEQYGWKWNGQCWIPIPSTSTAAPSVILQLIKCNCHGTCESGSCTCYKERLLCTEMCHYTGDKNCENSGSDNVTGIDSEDEELDDYPEHL